MKIGILQMKKNEEKKQIDRPQKLTRHSNNNTNAKATYNKKKYCRAIVRLKQIDHL